MKISTARDRHRCAVSKQKGELSPPQEKSDSSNTHRRPKEERVWSVLVHLSAPLLSFQDSAGRKTITHIFKQ